MTSPRPEYSGFVEAVRNCVSQVAKSRAGVAAKFTVEGDDHGNPIVVAFRTRELMCIDLVNCLTKIFEVGDIYGKTVRLKLDLGLIDKERTSQQSLQDRQFRRQLEAVLTRFGSCPGDFWLDDGTDPDNMYVFILSTPEVLDSGVIEELARLSTRDPHPFAVYFDVHSASEDWSRRPPVLG